MPPKNSVGVVVPFETEPVKPAQVETPSPAPDPITQTLTISLEDVQAMIAKAVAEKEAQLRKELADPAPAEKRPPVGDYPVTYYNPKIINERFRIMGSPYMRRFINGVYVATNQNDEESVRQALRVHGPSKPDRWRGDNRRNPWQDKRTGFTTKNDDAKDDFEHYHQD